MSSWHSALVGVAVAVRAYPIVAGRLIPGGRREDASAFLRFIPDCAVLFRGLLREPRVSRKRKVLLVALLGYLAMPIDLVPDFVPVIGQVDDAILVALVLRSVLRAG